MATTSPKTTSHLSAVRFVALLVLLMVISFPDVLLFGSSFVLRDFGGFGYPLAYYHRESFWHGEMPLWNPLSNGGLPFLAQWNTLTLYPLSLIYLLLPMPWSLSFYCLVHLFLAGVGMFFLVRKWTDNDLAAGVSGIAFAFSGLLLNALAWPNNIAAFAWMPWVLLTVENACGMGTQASRLRSVQQNEIAIPRQDAGASKSILIAVFVSATQMLSGAPEVIMLTWIFVSLLWLLGIFQHKEEQAKRLRRLLTIVALVSGLAAAQLLPFLDLMKHGERDYEILHRGIPAWGAFNFFVPLFRMTPTPQGFFFQGSQNWTLSYYVSIGAVALALLALVLHSKCKRIWLLAGFCLFALPMATGGNGPFYDWICKLVPGVDAIHFPVKFVIVTTFVLPLLAGMAFAELQTIAEQKPKRTLHFCTVVGVVFLLVIAGVLWFARSHPFPAEKWETTLSSGLTRAALLAGFLGVIALLPKLQRERSQLIATFALLFLVWLDSFTAMPKLNLAVNTSVFSPNLAATQFNPKPVHGTSRIALSRGAGEIFYSRWLSDPAKDLVTKRLVLLANLNLLEGIPKVGGFYSTYLPGQLTVIKELFYTSPTQFPENYADFLSVSHMNNATNALQWDFRPTHLPMATMGQKPHFLDFAETRKFLRTPEFNPRKVVCLPPETRNAITVANESLGKIVKSSFTAHRIELETESEQPSMLVLSHAFYHWWKAYVDDRPVEIFRANRAFQALQLPAGKHQVKLVYEDKLFRAGAVISILTLVGCFVAWIFLGRLSKNEK